MLTMWDMRPLAKDLTVGVCKGGEIVFGKSAKLAQKLLHKPDANMLSSMQGGYVPGVLTSYDPETKQIHVTKKKASLTNDNLGHNHLLTGSILQNRPVLSKTTPQRCPETKDADTVNELISDTKPALDGDATHSRNVSGSTLVASPIEKIVKLYESMLMPVKAIGSKKVSNATPAEESMALVQLEEHDANPEEGEMALLKSEINLLDIGQEKDNTRFEHATTLIENVKLFFNCFKNIATSMVGALVRIWNALVSSKVAEVMDPLVFHETTHDVTCDTAACYESIEDRMVVELFDQDSPLENAIVVVPLLQPESSADPCEEEVVIDALMFPKEDALTDSQNDTADDRNVDNDSDNGDQVFTDEEPETSASEDNCEHNVATNLNEKTDQDNRVEEVEAACATHEPVGEFGKGTDVGIQSVDHDQDGAFGVGVPDSGTNSEHENATIMNAKTTDEVHIEDVGAALVTPKPDNEHDAIATTDKKLTNDDELAPYTPPTESKTEQYSFADTSIRPDFTGRARNTFSAPNSAVSGGRAIHNIPGRAGNVPPSSGIGFQLPRPVAMDAEKMSKGTGSAKSASSVRAAREYSPPQLNAFTGSVSAEMTAVSEKIIKSPGVAKARSPSEPAQTYSPPRLNTFTGLTTSSLQDRNDSTMKTANEAAAKAKEAEHQKTMEAAKEAAEKLEKRAAVEKAVAEARAEQKRVADEEAAKAKAVEEKAAATVPALSRAEKRAAEQKKQKAMKKELKGMSRL